MFEAVESPISMTAGAAIAIARFVKMSGAKVIQCAADTDDAVGVSMEPAAADLDRIAVAKYNGCKTEVTAGAAIVAGVPVASDATGRAVTAVTGDRILGYAQTATAAAGEVVTVLLVKGGMVI